MVCRCPFLARSLPVIWCWRLTSPGRTVRLVDRDGRLAYRRNDHRRGGDGGFIPCLFMDDGGIKRIRFALLANGLVRLTPFQRYE